jgi:sugar phosphate isomerase/epimerase
MRVGCCVSGPDGIDALEGAGADFCELPVARAIAVEDAAFERLAARLAAGGVPVAACNVLLPAGLPVVGPDVDAGALDRHLELALRRMARLGVGMLVVGSGAARTVPAGFDRELAMAQFAAFLADVAERAEALGIVVVLEPLRTAETNLLNTVGEGAAFLREREVGPARLLADLYHMVEEREPLAALAGAADLLAHAHVAGPGRRPPAAGDVRPFLHALREAGYAGDCSIECSWNDVASEAGPAVLAVREAAG